MVIKADTFWFCEKYVSGEAKIIFLFFFNHLFRFIDYFQYTTFFECDQLCGVVVGTDDPGASENLLENKITFRNI